jgi:hypothetical protein
MEKLAISDQRTYAFTLLPAMSLLGLHYRHTSNYTKIYMQGGYAWQDNL